MFETLRRNAAAKVTLGTVLLLGCSMEPPPPPPGAPHKGGYSIDTPVDVISADPRGAAVLDNDVPGVMSNPKFQLFSDMSLSQLAVLSGGRLTHAKLVQVQADLEKLSAQEKAGK
jgi:hypothetical protein